jgi:hypothetical protein
MKQLNDMYPVLQKLRADIEVHLPDSSMFH